MRTSAMPGTLRLEDRRRGKPSTPRPAARDTGPPSASSPRRDVKRTFTGPASNVRVLVVFEDRYRAYRDAIASAIRSLRPRAEVSVTKPGSLEAAVARLDPHLVICSRPNTLDHETTLAWIELPHEPDHPAVVWLEGRSEATAPTLDGLLATIDEVVRLARTPSGA